MAEKRHTFIFSTPAGEVQVSTDDLQELSRHAWFTQYFNAPQATDNEEDSTYDIDYEAIEQEIERRAEQRAYVMAKDMTQAYLQSQRQEQQGGYGAAVPPQQAQPAPQPAQPQNTQRSAAAHTFLDIQPTDMTDEMWMKLTDDQKRQYAAKYATSK